MDIIFEKTGLDKVLILSSKTEKKIQIDNENLVNNIENDSLCMEILKYKKIFFNIFEKKILINFDENSDIIFYSLFHLKLKKFDTIVINKTTKEKWNYICFYFYKNYYIKELVIDEINEDNFLYFIFILKLNKNIQILDIKINETLENKKINKIFKILEKNNTIHTYKFRKPKIIKNLPFFNQFLIKNECIEQLFLNNEFAMFYKLNGFLATSFFLWNTILKLGLFFYFFSDINSFIYLSENFNININVKYNEKHFSFMEKVLSRIKYKENEFYKTLSLKYAKYPNKLKFLKNTLAILKNKNIHNYTWSGYLLSVIGIIPNFNERQLNKILYKFDSNIPLKKPILFVLLNDCNKLYLPLSYFKNLIKKKPEYVLSEDNYGRNPIFYTSLKGLGQLTELFIKTEKNLKNYPKIKFYLPYELLLNIFQFNNTFEIYNSFNRVSRFWLFAVQVFFKNKN